MLPQTNTPQNFIYKAYIDEIGFVNFRETELALEVGVSQILAGAVRREVVQSQSILVSRKKAATEPLYLRDIHWLHSKPIWEWLRTIRNGIYEKREMKIFVFYPNGDRYLEADLTEAFPFECRTVVRTEAGKPVVYETYGFYYRDSRLSLTGAFGV
jgi:hypothetical protein